MKAQDLPPEYLQRPLSAEVGYWCFRPSSSAGPLHDQLRKTRHVAVHASQPWLLSIELEQKTIPSVNLWDYAQHQLLWSKSCAEIYHDSTTESTLKPSKFKPSFVRTQMQSQSVDMTMSFSSVDLLGDRASDAPSKAGSSSGVIKDAKFGDLCALISCSPNKENAAQCGRILVVGDSFVIVYYSVLGKHMVINLHDLQRKMPSSVEALDGDHILIGCADGSVRVWNTLQNAAEATIQVFPKAEITAMRLIPPKL